MEVHTPEIKHVRDPTDALHIYCKTSNAALPKQNKWAEIKLRAEYKGGGCCEKSFTVAVIQRPTMGL